MNLKKNFFFLILFASVGSGVTLAKKNYSPFLAKKNQSTFFAKKINPQLPSIFIEEPIITDIIINGLVNVPIEVIYSKLPIRIGEVADSKKIAAITKNIFSIGYFTDVKVFYKKVSSGKDEKKNGIELYIQIQE